MDIESLKELKTEFEKVRKYNDMHCMSTVTEDDVLELIDEAIARQSVKSEEVAISKTETTSAKKIVVDIQLRPMLDELEVDIDDVKEYISKLN